MSGSRLPYIDPCEVCGGSHLTWLHGPSAVADHPHTDPGDGRTECDVCGKFVWPVTHSCEGVPVTDAAMRRMEARNV